MEAISTTSITPHFEQAEFGFSQEITPAKSIAESADCSPKPPHSLSPDDDIAAIHGGDVSDDLPTASPEEQFVKGDSQSATIDDEPGQDDFKNRKSDCDETSDVSIVSNTSDASEASAALKASEFLDEAERMATLALYCMAGVGAATINALKNAFGRLSDALKAPRKEAAEHFKSAEGRASFLKIDDLEAWTNSQQKKLNEVGAKPIFPGDSKWPSQLKDIDDFPLLFVKGDLSSLAEDKASIAIVGSRDVDECGQKIASFWSRNLASKNVTIISGGALGVDTESHRGALAESGKTIAVMGSGIDIFYPIENTELFQRIIHSGGAVISQFPLGTPPYRRNFILRNRLIAALSEAVLVARAAPGSGALSTAVEAYRLGRPVFAAPGDLTNPMAQGIQELIQKGIAQPIFHLSTLSKILSIEGPWLNFGNIPIGPPPSRRVKRTSSSPSCSSVSNAKTQSSPHAQRQKNSPSGKSSNQTGRKTQTDFRVSECESPLRKLSLDGSRSKPRQTSEPSPKNFPSSVDLNPRKASLVSKTIRSPNHPSHSGLKVEPDLPSAPCEFGIVSEIDFRMARDNADRKEAALSSISPENQVEALSPELRRIFFALNQSLQCFDDLVAKTKFDASQLADSLLRLELLGLCEEHPGRLFRRSSG